ncbi:hypothetical protein MMC34_001776 [Xylographa carneopallida]|nr:hypothetical protein [Xylographa carneopallida]
MAASRTTYTRTSSTHKFQLPPITTNSESLAAGTDIPPPPPSPPARKSSLAPPPPKSPNPLQQHPSTSSFALPLSVSIPGAFPTSPLASPSSPDSPTALPRIDYINSKSRAASGTLSRDSTSTSRSNSVRKFLSLRSLSGGWNNQSNTAANTPLSSRPASPSGTSTTSTRPSLNKKRSSLFWGRRKSSMMLDTRYEEEALDQKGQKGPENQENVRPSPSELPERMGSPPPRLPELEKLGGGTYGKGGFLDGDDMFRNIK